MHVTTDSAALTISFEGLEPFWELKNTLVIPRGQIADMHWHEQIRIPLRDVVWRVGGTATGTLFAGRFFGRSGKNFFVYQTGLRLVWANPGAARAGAGTPRKLL